MSSSGQSPQELEALMLPALLDAAAGAIIAANAKGRIELANKACLKLFGYRPDELIGKNVSMLMPQPDHGAHDGYIRHHLETGENRIIGIGREVVARHKQGHRLPVHLSIGEFSKDGASYFVGIMHDLSVQKLAENAVAQLGRVIDDSHNEVYLFDAETFSFTMVNNGARQNLGFSADELRRMTPLDIKPEYDRKTFRTLIQPLIDGAKKQILFRTSHRRKDGSVYPVEIDLHLSRVSEPPMFFAIAQDLTEQLEHEQQLSVFSRMESIGQLTGGIAHDLNNHLTIITGNIELLKDRCERDGMGQEVGEFLDDALDASQMGARLTDRLLTFARRRTLEPELINLNDFVLHLVDMLRRTIGRPIDLSTIVQKDLWLTRVDPGQIENAILNLAINARDAMPGGGRLILETRNVTLDAVYVSFDPDLVAGDYVLLSVSDTGTGMTADVRRRAFEPYFTTKPAGEGSGLGLSMIYGFIKQSGGHISIYSEQGYGTTINIYLPRSDEDQTERVSYPAKTVRSSVASEGATVLVVEDDDRVRRLTISRLHGAGFEILEAANGKEALDILAVKGDSIDLLFTDLVMPGGISGFELARQVRETHESIGILLTSGYAEELVNDGHQKEQPFLLLRKPYGQADLMAMIAEALEARAKSS